ncbi:unnamed protein product, partial [Adineta ricciae]
MSSRAPKQCSICRSPLNTGELDEITTSCGHTFHRKCAQKRLDRYNKTDCQVCRRECALGDALSKQNTTPPKSFLYLNIALLLSSAPEKYIKLLLCKIEILLPKIGSLIPQTAFLLEIIRRFALHVHSFIDLYFQGRRRKSSVSSAHSHHADNRESSHSPTTSDKNKEHDELTEDNHDRRPLSSPRMQGNDTVYVVNLPPDIKDDFDLTNAVRTHVENSLQISIRDIKCYGKLGVGVIRVPDRQTKNRLVQSIQEITLNVGGKSNTIQFVDTLELISFVVLEINKDLSYPSAKEINVRWKDLYGGERPRSCEQFDRYFPNIYRLVTTSLDEILQIMHNSDFSVKKQNGRVYFCANCSFLTDLPTSTFEDEIRS